MTVSTAKYAQWALGAQVARMLIQLAAHQDGKELWQAPHQKQRVAGLVQRVRIVREELVSQRRVSRERILLEEKVNARYAPKLGIVQETLILRCNARVVT